MTKKKEQKIKISRTPVISVMGHVDHGKTTLLDTIRGANIAASEEGGITQNTRAHQIEYKGQKLTFLDTPGHEAFSDMRSRGARFTDIVLLVVAADDGVQPQTKESIKFAKASKSTLIVAINKIDMPGANPAKVKQALANNDVLVEEFGGDVLSVEISAKLKKGIDELLDTILLQAEILELKKNKVTQGKAEAVVLESTLHKTRGAVALVLIRGGGIEKGDFVVSSHGVSKIRGLINEFGKEIDAAQEGDPVTIIGIDKVISTGEQLLFVDDLDQAQKLFKEMQRQEPVELVKEIEEEIASGEEDNLGLLAQLLDTNTEKKETKFLKVVVKTDTQGTLEALIQKLNEIGDLDDVKIKILSSGTGAITEKDVLTAKNSGGLVIGFQTEMSGDVELIAKREKVLVRNYTIIYKLIEEIEAVLNSMLDPEEEIVEVSRAEIKKIFVLSNGEKVFGSRVLKGNVIKGYKCLVMRGEEEVGNGKIISLKQNKADVKEVKKEQECGIIIEPDIEASEGDIIVCYKIEKL